MPAEVRNSLDRADGVFAAATAAANGCWQDGRYGVDTSQYEYAAAHLDTRTRRINYC
jgi:hypothetical protein